MFWMTRPPYLRWAAAAAILAVGFVIELRPSDSIEVPVTTVDVAAGSVLDPSDVVWRDAPADLFSTVDLPATVTRRVPAGSVVTPADLRSGSEPIPPGWWSIQLPVPAGTTPGDDVLAVIVSDTATTSVRGRVASEVLDDGFSALDGLVAFAPADAVAVAEAAMENRVTVLLGH